MGPAGPAVKHVLPRNPVEGGAGAFPASRRAAVENPVHNAQKAAARRGSRGAAAARPDPAKFLQPPVMHNIIYYNRVIFARRARIGPPRGAPPQDKASTVNGFP